MSQDRDAAPVQSTTLEAELVSSGRGEGDPGSRLRASLPCPDLSTLWNGFIVCRKPRRFRRGYDPDVSPTYFVCYGRREGTTRITPEQRSQVDPGEAEGVTRRKRTNNL